MTNEEFQRVVLQELKDLKNTISGIEKNTNSIEKRVANIEERVTNIEERVTNIEERVTNIEERVTNIEERQKILEIRQDEIYQIVRAIEHSNQVGRSEIDSQNIRLAKVEGKLKKVSKVLNEDTDIDKVSNL